ncbi:MAG: S9 family peptidase, partial [Thermoanaerobaculia bacterium]
MRKTIACLSLFLSACLLLSAAPAPPRPPVDSVLDSLESIKNFREAAISPDGSRVAWVEKIRDRQGAELLSAIYVSDLSAGSARRIGAAHDGRICRERDVAWSPDGASLAFLSDAAQPPQFDLYVVPAAGGPVRRLTRVTGQLQRPRWSPDGKTIAFLFTAGSTQEPGALVAYRPDSGVVGEKIEEQRIALLDRVSGRLREVSPENLYVYDYDWSPDGKRLAAEAAEGSGTNNYWIAELYTVEADSGKTRSLWKPPLQIACPRFSPDGKSIALIHGIMSDEGSTGGDIWVVPATGGQAKNLTPGMKFSASTLFWRPTGEILFRGYLDGHDGLATLDPGSGRIDPLRAGVETLRSFSLARAGTQSAAIRDSFTD